jgi:hypothetical protein
VLRKTKGGRESPSASSARGSLPRLDIGFDAMNRDWRTEVDRIYGFLDMELHPGCSRR